MSKRGWCGIVAAIGLIATAASGQTQENQNGEQRPEQAEQQAAQPLPAPILVDIIQDETAAEARQRREQEAAEREKLDLAAQQGMDAATRRMAELAVWQTIFVGVGTALLFATLFATLRANQAAWRVANDTRKQLAASLAVELNGFALNATSRPPYRPLVHIMMSNHGPSAATNISFQARFLLGNEIDRIITQESERGLRTVAPHGGKESIIPNTEGWALSDQQVEAVANKNVMWSIELDLWFLDGFERQHIHAAWTCSGVFRHPKDGTVEADRIDVKMRCIDCRQQ